MVLVTVWQWSEEGREEEAGERKLETERERQTLIRVQKLAVAMSTLSTGGGQSEGTMVSQWVASETAYYALHTNKQ